MNMKSLIKLLLIGGLFFSMGIETLSGQMLFFSGKKKVYINSEPQGAVVSIDGQVIGLTPCTVKIKMPKMPLGSLFNVVKIEGEPDLQKMAMVNVIFSKEGYESGIVPFCPDANMQYPSTLFYSFEEGGSSQAVNRSNPGATDLERTIVRWYFESEPQGARIFWRVISNVPAEVPNTNELWLGNTPFEETRSFNIQGLTYENANDVQIEIKVKRAGYLDQTKRFNIRQAIDQQEISSFFDMIKAEEE